LAERGFDAGVVTGHVIRGIPRHSPNPGNLLVQTLLYTLGIDVTTLRLGYRDAYIVRCDGSFDSHDQMLAGLVVEQSAVAAVWVNGFDPICADVDPTTQGVGW
jgi:hypothetical protein